MINLNKMWKSIGITSRCKRSIKEVEFKNINLNEYIIIDVRSRREFGEHHLKGAINIPLFDIKRNANKYIKDKTKKILVCCEYGIRSKKAAEYLEDIGYINVYNLKNGLENI